jgi:hypothetical protein
MLANVAPSATAVTKMRREMVMILPVKFMSSSGQPGMISDQ